MNNKHLIPVNVNDIGDRILILPHNTNEKYNLILRMEAIIEYCDEILNKAKMKPKR
jgi:hypothetical protein